MQPRGTSDAPLGSATSEATMNLILFLIFGLVVGALARVIVPGREPGGWLASMLLGVAGAFLGGLIGRAFGLYSSDVTTGGFVLCLIGANAPPHSSPPGLARRLEVPSGPATGRL